MKEEVTSVYRVSPKAVHKLGGEVGNIVRSHNYIGEHGQKAIGGAAREFERSAHVVSSFQTWTACDGYEHYTNAELMDIYFICALANGNERTAVRLHGGGRYLTRRQPTHQAFTRVHQNLAEHGSQKCD
ncbi:hypothetical protein TNCV_1763281 [Trichonephila clavipes]|nr:hypothetical protein TNCV_1763281 [Trichonephila clavipes]